MEVIFRGFDDGGWWIVVRGYRGEGVKDTKANQKVPIAAIT